jgi:hypothetical protein
MMFSKQFLRRFSTQSNHILQLNNIIIVVSHKFPEGTVAGVYKRALLKNDLVDAVRFDAQKFNWTLKEFDVIFSLIILIFFFQRYTSAFAFGLLENGFSKG